MKTFGSVQHAWRMMSIETVCLTFLTCIVILVIRRTHSKVFYYMVYGAILTLVRVTFFFRLPSVTVLDQDIRYMKKALDSYGWKKIMKPMIQDM